MNDSISSKAGKLTWREARDLTRSVAGSKATNCQAKVVAEKQATAADAANENEALSTVLVEMKESKKVVLGFGKNCKGVQSWC